MAKFCRLGRNLQVLGNSFGFIWQNFAAWAEIYNFLATLLGLFGKNLNLICVKFAVGQVFRIVNGPGIEKNSHLVTLQGD